MQAVILAAGEGVRMRPLTYEIPKPMIRLRNKPIVEYTLRWLPKEFDEVVMVVNYLGEQIQDYFGENYHDKKIRYVFQEELNGTGGAVHRCREILGERFMVLVGDDLFGREDLKKLGNKELGLFAYRVTEPFVGARIEVNNDGSLARIVEKSQVQPGDLVSSGGFALTSHFFDYPLVKITETEYGLPQTLVSMAQDYPVEIIEATHWQPVGRMEELEKAEEVLGEFL
jgi:bifunctional UDP-N-acetylglucosamine pyrophosphorylase/glucosamine-1-phosphate N-acetyltransferase